MEVTENISHFDDKPIRGFITNIGKYNEGDLIGEWHKFPTTPEALAGVFERIGIDCVNYEEWFITDYETVIDGIDLNEYDDLDNVNYLAVKLEEMSKCDLEKLEAVLDYYDGDMIAEIINLTEDNNLDCFDVYSDVHSEEDLGTYMIEESGMYDTKAMGELAQYIDYESLGRDVYLNERSEFTDSGYVRQTSDISKVFDNSDVPEEYQIVNKARKIVLEKAREKAKTPKSINARIEADRKAKKAESKKPAPAKEKSKTQKEIDL